MADRRAIFTGSFPSGMGFNTHPEMTLSGPNEAIPSYAIVREVTLNMLMGVGVYNRDLDANFNLYDSSGGLISIENTVWDDHSPSQQELAGYPDKQLDWNNLSKVSMYGSNRLFTRSNTSEIWVDYDLPTAPQPPQNVRMEPTSVAGGPAGLLWDAAAPGRNNPVDHYDIYYWDIDNDDLGEKLGSTAGLAYTVVAAPGNGSKVAFVVFAIGSVPGFDSTFSRAAVLKTEWSAPGVPGKPVLSANQVPPESAVVLSWAAAAPGVNNLPRIYEVWRSVDGGPFALLTQTAQTSVSVNAPAKNGVGYSYQVKACGTVSGSDSGFSAASDELYCSFSAPNAPSGLTVNGKADVFVDAGENLHFAWSPATSGTNNPLEKYVLFSNGRKVAETTSTVLDIEADFLYGEKIAFDVRAQGKYSISPPSNQVFVTINVPPAPPRSTEAVSEFFFLDKDDVPQFIRDDAISLKITEEEYKITGVFPYDPEKEILHSMRIGWLERDELMLFEIRQPTTDAVLLTQSFEAEHVAVAELLDEVIEDKRPQGKTAAEAVQIALYGTLWRLGKNTFGGQMNSTNYYMESVWSALLKVRDKWGCTIRPRVAYVYGKDGAPAIERYIDVLDRRGENRGVRLTLDLNTQQAGVTYDDRELYTALIGRGASPGEGQHLITFESAFWSIDNGNPANKPVGQKFVEDVAATAFWGRHGRKRTGFVEFDTTDPNELLRLTWAALQQMKNPHITIDMTAFNLAGIGYSWQGLEWGDDVVVVLDEINVEIQARVTQFERDVLRPENSKPVIGDYRPDLVFEVTRGLGGGQTTVIQGGPTDAYTPDNPPPYPVTSVDGKTGAVNTSDLLIHYSSAVDTPESGRRGTWVYMGTDSSGTDHYLIFTRDVNSGITLFEWTYNQKTTVSGYYPFYNQLTPPPYPVTSVNGMTGAVNIPTGGGIKRITVFAFYDDSNYAHTVPLSELPGLKYNEQIIALHSTLDVNITSSYISGSLLFFTLRYASGNNDISQASTYINVTYSI